jgi:hypothetical protein
LTQRIGNALRCGEGQHKHANSNDGISVQHTLTLSAARTPPLEYRLMLTRTKATSLQHEGAGL